MTEAKLKRLIAWLKSIGYYHLARQLEVNPDELQKALRTPE